MYMFLYSHSGSSAVDSSWFDDISLDLFDRKPSFIIKQCKYPCIKYLRRCGVDFLWCHEKCIVSSSSDVILVLYSHTVARLVVLEIGDTLKINLQMSLPWNIKIRTNKISTNIPAIIKDMMSYPENMKFGKIDIFAVFSWFWGFYVTNTNTV